VGIGQADYAIPFRPKADGARLSVNGREPTRGTRSPTWGCQSDAPRVNRRGIRIVGKRASSVSVNEYASRRDETVPGRGLVALLLREEVAATSGASSPARDRREPPRRARSPTWGIGQADSPRGNRRGIRSS